MQTNKGSDYCDWDGDNTYGGGKWAVFSSTYNRIFYLFGEINARNCADIAYDISRINYEDDEKDEKEKDFKRKPIKIYLNSFGGSVYDMWLLVDTIMNSKTPVHTYCTGYAMSAAFIIFLSGHKRYMSLHATLMYHQIYCWRSGKYQDLVDDRQQTDHLNNMIECFVVERTGLTKDDLLNIREKKRDTYFSAKEAEELKIIDEIMSPSQSDNENDEN